MYLNKVKVINKNQCVFTSLTLLFLSNKTKATKIIKFENGCTTQFEQASLSHKYPNYMSFIVRCWSYLMPGIGAVRRRGDTKTFTSRWLEYKTFFKLKYWGSSYLFF